MAVSDQEVAAWLAANPLATDAQIAAAMDQYGVSSAQMARVTGIPLPDVLQRKTEAQKTSYVPGQRTLPGIEERVIDMGEGQRSEFFVKGTNIRVDEPTYTENWNAVPLTESSVAPRTMDNLIIYDEKLRGEHVYSPEGQYLGFVNAPRESGLGAFIKEAATETAPIWMAALTAGYAPQIGAAVAPSLSSAAQLGIGSGAIAGGGTLVTGGSVEDALKNALIAGGTAYAGSSLFGGADTQAGLTDRQLAIADAKQLADAGLNTAQIQDVLSSAGFNEAIISRALGSLGPLPTNGVVVTAPTLPVANPAGAIGGLLTSTPVVTSVTPQPPVTSQVTQPAEQPSTPPSQNVLVTGARPLTGIEYALANGMTAAQYYNNIRNWFAANPNATQAQIEAAKNEYGVTDEEINTALDRNLQVTDTRPQTPAPVAPVIPSLPSVTPTVPPTSQLPGAGERVEVVDNRPTTPVVPVIPSIPPTTPGLLTPTPPPTSELPGAGEKVEVVDKKQSTPTIPYTPITEVPVQSPITDISKIEIPKIVSDNPNLTLSDLLKIINSLGLLGGGLGIGGGGGGQGTGTFVPPTQGVPQYSSDYYNAIQRYYDAYLPAAPRDVATPLQQWYENSFGNTGTNTTVAPQQAQTAMSSMPTVPTPVAPTPVPMSPTPSGTVMPVAASTGLFSTPTTAQQQVQNLLSNSNLSSLPPEAAAAISRAVSAPRSYNDVVASGGQNTVDVSSLSPEVQRAYDLYQQSMILGANQAEVKRAYEKAGVNPANPDAFFESQGLLTGTPTQTALAKYAPLALDRFAGSGGGALTYTVDPSTVPSTYTAPTLPNISFNMDKFIESINNNTTINFATKQRIIAEQAAKRGFNPSEFI